MNGDAAPGGLATAPGHEPAPPGIAARAGATDAA